MDFCENNILVHKGKSPVQNISFCKFGYISANYTFWSLFKYIWVFLNAKNQCCFSLFDISVLLQFYTNKTIIIFKTHCLFYDTFLIDNVV